MNRILLIFFCLLSVSAWADESTSTDSTHRVYVSGLPQDIREFQDQSLDEFREDSDFRYHVEPRREVSWFDRLLGWILYYLLRTLAFLTTTVPGKVLFYTLCALLILFAIVKLFNIDVKEMFFNVGKAKQPSLVFHEEDIHEISFDDRIDAAYRKGDLRECVRLTFLYALKKLSDNQLINWRAGKTNDDYLRELKDHPSRLSLQELRLYFDYAWYGHFDVDEETYKSIQRVFGDFKSKVD